MINGLKTKSNFRNNLRFEATKKNVILGIEYI